MKALLQSGRIALLLSVAAGTVALADVVGLDPFTPGALAVAEVNSEGNVEEFDTNVLAIAPSTPLIPATAFASLINGALGIRIVGGPGIGGNAGADLYVNVSFQGTGTNTVNLDVDGNYGVQGDPLTDGVLFGAGISCYSVVDVAIRQGKDCGVARVNEHSEDQGQVLGPGNISFPAHLSLQFTVDPEHTLFQFVFGLSGTAFGAATLNAIHTGLISFDLAPGVTFDQSNGFLTSPGDVILPGEGNPPPAVPEPSMLAATGCGFVALIGYRARQRSRRI